MRIRSTGLTLFAGLSIFVAACSSGDSSTAPSAAAPSTAPSAAAPSAAQRRRRRPRRRRPQPTSDLKIGVVTDVGTVNDKNFNEFTLRRRPATVPPPIGAETPPVVVPTAPSDYAPTHPGVRRPGLQHHRGGRLQPRPATDGRGQGQPGHLVHRRRPRPVHRRERATSRPDFADCSGDVADAAPELHRDQLPGRPGRLSRRHRRRVGQQDRHHRRRRRRRRLRPVHPLHPGLRARRQVGQPGRSRSSRPSCPPATSKALRRPGRWQDVRRPVHHPEHGPRRPVPGRRPDRQRRHRRRLRGEHQRHRRRRRPARVLCRPRRPAS